MAIPIAYFDFTSSGRTVKFIDLSENAPTGWSWDFGDGTPVNNTQNPEHLYTQDGSYKVTLTATNSDGNNALSFTLMVKETDGAGLSIQDMVKLDLPNEIKIDPVWLSQAIRKWQAWLQPLVYKPFEVAAADTYNQLKWPNTINTLIQKLVIYDLINLQLKGNLASGNSSITSGKGGLKSLEAGPSKAEWYEVSDKVLTSMNQPGGVMDAATYEICMIATAAGLIMPMCIAPNTYHPFRVYKQSKPNPYATRY